MNNRFKSSLIQPWPPQTHATELDGTKDRGLLLAGRALWRVDIWGKADASLDWTIEVEIPNPKVPATPTVFPWLSATGPSITDCISMLLPAGSKVRVKTSAGTNPLVQFVTGLSEAGA
jgi:hypothetical protein